jgi:hypothetical protein
VVDGNIVYARRVQEFLIQHAKNVEVDVAQNVPIMRRRLLLNNYDLIIADIHSIFDSKGLLVELNQTQIPKVIWTMINESIQGFGRIFHKPTGYIEMNAILSQAVPEALVQPNT